MSFRKEESDKKAVGSIATDERLNRDEIIQSSQIYKQINLTSD